MPYLLRHVQALARRAAMSTTYKPALLKALSRLAARGVGPTIPLSVIGDEFARLYWNQTIVFHLRQAATLRKEPEVLQRIRSAAQRYGVSSFNDLPETARTTIANSIAKVLTVDVLRRFHASAPPGLEPLYQWSEGNDVVVLPPLAMSFLREETLTLQLIANHWWAGYLEKVNVLAPFIIQKVERDGARRASLSRFFQLLISAGEHDCFYCGVKLSRDATAVDHVLPWSFLLADPIWNLVLACRDCNARKSDKLPGEPYIEKLIRFNRVRAGASLLAQTRWHDDEVRRLYQAAVSLEWPAFWNP